MHKCKHTHTHTHAQVEKTLQGLGLSERTVRASSQQAFHSTVAQSRARGSSSRVGPQGRWQVGTAQRPPSSTTTQPVRDAYGRPLSATSTKRALLARAEADKGFHESERDRETTAAPVKPKRNKVSKRVYKAKRTTPPYSHAAYSSAVLLQSVFRGHTQRVLLLVTRRLQPSFEMPTKIAALAHTMIQMPTAFKMFKRMLLYYKRHGRGMRIPPLDFFRWPNPGELQFLFAMVLRLQCAYRQHLGVKQMQDRLNERADAARIENIIKHAQQTIGSQSTVGATRSLREGLTTRDKGATAQEKEHISRFFDLGEAEQSFIEGLSLSLFLFMFLFSLSLSLSLCLSLFLSLSPSLSLSLSLPGTLSLCLSFSLFIRLVLSRFCSLYHSLSPYLSLCHPSLSFSLSLCHPSLSFSLSIPPSLPPSLPLFLSPSLSLPILLSLLLSLPLSPSLRLSLSPSLPLPLSRPFSLSLPLFH